MVVILCNTQYTVYMIQSDQTRDEKTVTVTHLGVVFTVIQSVGFPGRSGRVLSAHRDVGGRPLDRRNGETGPEPVVSLKEGVGAG